MTAIVIDEQAPDGAAGYHLAVAERFEQDAANQDPGRARAALRQQAAAHRCIAAEIQSRGPVTGSLVLGGPPQLGKSRGFSTIAAATQRGQS